MPDRILKSWFQSVVERQHDVVSYKPHRIEDTRYLKNLWYVTTGKDNVLINEAEEKVIGDF